MLRIEAEPYVEGPAGEFEEVFVAKNETMPRQPYRKDEQEKEATRVARQPGSVAEKQATESFDLDSIPPLVINANEPSMRPSVPGSPLREKLDFQSSVENILVQNRNPCVETKARSFSPQLHSIATGKQSKGLKLLPRCYTHDHRGAGSCIRPQCPYAHVCSAFTKGKCSDESCLQLHSCIDGSQCRNSSCQKLHVASVQVCKFGDKSMCLSDECVMIHTRESSDSSQPVGKNKIPSNVCVFFNLKSGCLSQRSNKFLCEFSHCCNFCGNPQHGRCYCPHNVPK